MPSLPTSGDVHVNTPLTNVLISHLQQVKSAGAKAFPMIGVPKQSNKYFVWDRGDFNRDVAARRGPGDLVNLARSRLSTDDYTCDVYAVGKQVSDQERANQDQPLDLDKTATEVCGNLLMIKREKVWQDAAFKLGVWSTDLVGGVDFTQWSNYTTSDPIKDIRDQMFEIAKVPGVDLANMTLVLGPEVFQILLDHPKFLERYEQVQAAILNEQLMAAVLGIKQVVVPMMVETTSAEGVTPITSGYIHGKSALLIWTPPNPGINVPSAGYGFVWTGMGGADGEGVRAKRYRREEYACDQIECESAWDFKVCTPALGKFFSVAVA